MAAEIGMEQRVSRRHLRIASLAPFFVRSRVAHQNQRPHPDAHSETGRSSRIRCSALQICALRKTK